MSQASDEYVSQMQKEISVTFEQHCEKCKELIPIGKEIYLMTQKDDNAWVCQHIVCKKCSKLFKGKKLKDWKA
jgi:hypothetical protein